MITKEMTIEEILTKFPEHSQSLAQEMTDAGLHCVGCGAAATETLEEGATGHGMTQEELVDLLDKLNVVVARELDLATVTLTPRAAKKLLEIMQEEEKVGWALRFGLRPGGCSGFEYTLDFSQRPKSSDRVFHAHNVEIHIDEGSVGSLLGSMIDFVGGINGAFKISNPNAKKSCGCGKSQKF